MSELDLVKIIKENIERESIENDFNVLINNNNFLPSIKYIVVIDEEKTGILKAYQL